MPKKSKKSKSKRMCLKQKYKIIKKVKEHHKKKRKEERKAAKSGTKKKAQKDPGLPSQWPYKEELVKEFAFLRAKALADDKRKKEEQRLARQVRSCRPASTVPSPSLCTLRPRHRPLHCMHAHPCMHVYHVKRACHGDVQVRDTSALAAADATGGDTAQLLALARLQASAASKQEDFETRKRARLTTEFNSDAGGWAFGTGRTAHSHRRTSPARALQLTVLRAT
jgi:nuclear GTP-binding protein